MAYSLLGPRRRFAALLSLASSLFLAVAPLRAEVVGIGDVTPAIQNPDPPPAVLIPNLPQFGGFVDVVIVGGTGQFIGGTEAGQMTIDLPTDTDPLVSNIGAIGYTAGGQGLARVLGLNSEWQINNFLYVAAFGQGSLQLSAGARVGPPANAPITNQMAVFAGYAEGSQGFIRVDGFTSLLKSYTLSIGRAGAGTMALTNGARVETTFEAQIGGDAFIGNSTNADLTNGVGLVTLDGQATRWNIGIPLVTNLDFPPGLPTPPNTTAQVADLYVGKVGRGELQIQNQAWTRVSRDVYIGSAQNSYGETTVTGQGSTLWALRDLNVGNAVAGANLTINDDGLVRVDDDVVIGKLGFVNMGGGTLLNNTTDGSITNNGVIRGDGRVDTGLNVTLTNNGYLRNGAGIANIRERLLFTGPVTNTENIESVGGEMEFQGVVTNNGTSADIVGINAIYRFDAGLVNNSGNLYFKNTLVWTPQGAPQTVTNSANLVVLEGESQLMGNLALTSSSEFSVEIGHTSSLLSVNGTATLAGRLVVTGIDDLLGEGAGDGYAPGVGNSFEILTANTVTGVFADIDDLFSGIDFSVTYEPGRVLLNVIGGAFEFNADFDGNGFVDGFDYLTWLSNRGATGVTPGTLGDADGDGNVDDTDYDIWKDQFGGPPPAVVAAGAVPEPTAAVLALMALVPLARRRR